MSWSRRRWLASVGLPALLAGCGFRLRGSQRYPFESLAITPDATPGSVASELTRQLGSLVVPLTGAEGQSEPQIICDVLHELREKTVVGVNASGQVRELQLRLNVRFRVRTPAGLELVEPTEIVLQRDISFNESAVLAKDAEEVFIYREMQADIVQQLQRRLAALPVQR